VTQLRVFEKAEEEAEEAEGEGTEAQLIFGPESRINQRAF
jgi:hypothetical protein